MTLLLAGNALSHRQTWQMNTQHDPGAFVIWCSLSNGFTADDPGQKRTKCSTPEAKNRLLRGITRLTFQLLRLQGQTVNFVLNIIFPFARMCMPFVYDRHFLNLPKDPAA